MATLDSIDRDYFERLFGMGSGYVLDFSNRAFREFVYGVMKINIYERYSGLSKAKILRNIIADYDNRTVGKLLLELLRYMQARDMIGKQNKDIFQKCVGIGNRLIGKKVATETPSCGPAPAGPTTTVIDHAKYLSDLTKLSDYPDTPQGRGYAFEKYLYELFAAYALEPRGSFKIIGEQIDGSFVLCNSVYLLEAKWTTMQANKASLVVFNEKVLSKSGFTRGLYLFFLDTQPKHYLPFQVAEQ